MTEKEIGDVNGALVWADDPDGSGKDCMDCVASTHGTVLARAYRDAQARIAELECANIPDRYHEGHECCRKCVLDNAAQAAEIKDYRELLKRIWKSTRLERPRSTLLDEIDTTLARCTHVYPKGTAPSEWEENGQDKP